MWLKEVVFEACQHVPKNTVELDAVKRAKQLRAVIVQLQQDNEELTSMVHPETPPQQVEEQKSAIEDVVT